MRGRRLAILIGALGLLAAPSVSAAAPPQSGAIDFQMTVQLGVNAQYSTVTAPFNITAPGPGMGRLNFMEIHSENGLPFNVSVYRHEEYNAFCATANQGKALVEGDRVTHFMLDFNHNPRVETQPAGNHTESFTYVQRFASMPTDARDTAYMVIVERREVEPSTVNFTLDRVAIAGPLPGDFAPATLAAIVVIVVAAAATHRSKPRP